MANAIYVITVLVSLVAMTNSTLISTALRRSYCRMTSCKVQNSHTLCKYHLAKPSSKCGKVTSEIVTPAEIKELLEELNPITEFTKIPLKWDRELAIMAQTWANQCELKLDECRDSRRFKVGQSYSYAKSKGPFTIPIAELLLLDEVPKGATLVGCGAIRYNANRKANTTYLVCNYGLLAL